MKRKNFAVLAAALVLSAGAGTSYAYLTAQDNVMNVFDTAEAKVQIEEDFDPEPPEPGKVIKKAPKAQSSSDTDCYVRMRYEFSSSDAKNLCEPVKINPGWTLRNDGYYYWNDIVKPGGYTGTLFDEIQVKSGIKKADIIPFDILVYAEAVQSGKMGEAAAWASMDSDGG